MDYSNLEEPEKIDFTVLELGKTDYSNLELGKINFYDLQLQLFRLRTRKK